jgi:hypothetical protein
VTGLANISTFSGVLNVTGNANVTALNVTGSAFISQGLTVSGITITIPSTSISYPSVHLNTQTNQLTYNPNKTFVIDHPLDDKKYLVHACLEGPESGVYYRGFGFVRSDIGIVIELPNYVDLIATNFTVHLTAIDKKANLWASRIKNNRFMVYSDENVEFDYIVYGTRQSIDSEPNKDEYIKLGSGPYTWIQKK